METRVVWYKCSFLTSGHFSEHFCLSLSLSEGVALSQVQVPRPTSHCAHMKHRAQGSRSHRPQHVMVLPATGHFDWQGPVGITGGMCRWSLLDRGHLARGLCYPRVGSFALQGFLHRDTNAISLPSPPSHPRCKGLSFICFSSSLLKLQVL